MLRTEKKVKRKLINVQYEIRLDGEKKLLKRHNIMGVGERDEAPLYKTKNKKQKTNEL